MNIKPRNFDNNIEQSLMKLGICSQSILDKYSPREKRYFFNQVYIAAVGRRAHPNAAKAFSLYASDRRKHITRASRFSEMKRDIPLIQKICNHLKEKWPDGYIITSDGRNVFNKSCKSVLKNCGHVNDDNHPYNPPRNGIRSQLKDGRKCKFKGLVANEISVNVFSLKRLANELQTTGRNESLISQIELILAMVRASKSGCLPITYRQSKGGRFCAEGAHNLQNCSRIIRHAGLVDHYDIDIENCHYTLLAQMCNRIEVKTPNINHYIENKKQVRTEVAELFECSEEMAKEILIALLRF